MIPEPLRCRLNTLWDNLILRLFGNGEETRSQRVIRRIRIGIVIMACLVTLQSVLLVLGAWRNDQQIERHLGVAEATVLDAGHYPQIEDPQAVASALLQFLGHG